MINDNSVVVMKLRLGGDNDLETDNWQPATSNW